MHQIFTSFNEKYRVVAAACIASLFKHTDPDVEIIILDTGINKRTKTKFQKWAKRENRILEFISITAETYKYFLGNDSELPNDIAYYPRLIAPYLASKNFEKILYIDADIICLRNPIKIFDVNLNENIIGAVQNGSYKIENGILNYQHLGLDESLPYFNSGMMIIDINKWKLNKVSERVLISNKLNKKFITHYDQYSLNIVLYNKWKLLSHDWNEILQAREGLTVFRHFADIKPLSPYFTSFNADLFFAYLKLSPYTTWWWESIALRFFLAKFQWKLKVYSNKIFNTKFPTDTLNI
jgi:lipopolysaccharide biosynthesis glycosyltransferase